MVKREYCKKDDKNDNAESFNLVTGFTRRLLIDKIWELLELDSSQTGFLKTVHAVS